SAQNNPEVYVANFMPLLPPLLIFSEIPDTRNIYLHGISIAATARDKADSPGAQRVRSGGGRSEGGSADVTATLDDVDGGTRAGPGTPGPGDGACPTRNGPRQPRGV